MAVTASLLISAKDAEATLTTQYTSSGVKTIIDKFTGCNHSASAVTLTVHIVLLSNIAADSNIICKEKKILPGETYTFPEIVGHVMNNGDFISTIASVASAVSIRASGRKIT